MAPEGGGELLMFHRHTQLEFVNIQFKIEALDNSICFSHITQITKKNKESKKKIEEEEAIYYDFDLKFPIEI